uniref:Head-tail joining protein n=1 Tax=viral metagenome TaxID=1070528 RepID=A0A6H1ZV79_9ZZZZ
MAIEDFYCDTVTPLTLADTTDAMGGSTRVWNTGTTFKGRLQSIYGDIAVSVEKEKAITTDRLYCAPEVTLTIYQRVRVSGIDYEIVRISKKRDKTSVRHKEIDLSEL